MFMTNVHECFALETLLCCPISGGTLRRIDVANTSVSFQKNVERLFDEKLWGAPWDKLTGWWTIDQLDHTIYYPEIVGIPVLISDVSFFLFNDGRVEIKSQKPLLNPFAFHENTNPEFYRKYETTVKFKTEYVLSKIPQRARIIVELLSSEGITLREIQKKNINREVSVFIAVDLDLYALINAQSNGLIAVCGDLRNWIFQANCIDFFFSNSMHHIPNDTTLVYQYIIDSLTSSGTFAGIESQGSISKVLLFLIGHFPTPFLPFLLKEIKEEYELLSDWLSIPIEERLRKAKISKEMSELSSNMTHVFYSISKVNNES
jgi:hypothetical protein